MRRRSLALILLALCAAGLAGGLVLWNSRDEGFEIQGRHIVDPDGDRFIVRGVVLAYGTFAGGDGGGVSDLNAARFKDDAKRIKASGANLVRIMTTPDTARPDNLALLYRVVAAAREQGLVVQIGSAFADFDTTLPYLRLLARRFADDPYVWLQPMNEPNCNLDESEQPGACTDWPRWQREHRMAIAAIRAEGVRSPIVVNVPGFSSDLRRIGSYPLGDPDVIYGAHRYGNDNLTFKSSERADVEAVIGGPSRRHPVIIDEFGLFNGPQFPNALPWVDGMTRWTADWVRRGDGQGATGFNWRWSDSNTMLEPDDRLTPWGKIFTSQILHGLDPRNR